jgi:hypothetical protein
MLRTAEYTLIIMGFPTTMQNILHSFSISMQTDHRDVYFCSRRIPKVASKRTTIQSTVHFYKLIHDSLSLFSSAIFLLSHYLILTLITNGGNSPVCVPMEEAIIGGCALCAFLGKVACYISKPNVAAVDAIELVGQMDGRKVTAVVDPQHGKASNEVLVELLGSVRPGAIVTMNFKVCRKKRIGCR